ncbi:MAG: D-alanyl-D-alanine carboxypeptidase [Oscillospiraceae bacterium]|nr:D-alanyl-D-alanine carboxypeptidase [Oscillospiraceae bacterium]
MKKLFSLLLAAALFLTLPAFALAADEEAPRPATEIAFDLDALTGKAIYVVNRETGRVVYEKNAQERMYPASTTKIMTAALALELCADPANTIVTVPAGVWNEFAGINISSAGLMGGEEITMLDLVHCMLLQSANEAASTVAAYYGREEFIAMMNAKAAELGCTDTHFTNPHGLFDEQHYSTAADLYKITEWAMSVPGFWEISCKSRYELPATNKHDSRWLVTTVKLQDKTSGYYTSYVRGIKTGTIDESGRCLVSAAEKNGESYVAVVLGCPTEYSTLVWGQGNSVFTDTRRIYDWCFGKLELKNVVQAGDPVSEVSLRWSAKSDYLMVYAAEDVATLLRTDTKAQPVITYETELPQSIKAPVEAGQVIGTAKVYSDGIYIGDVDLVAWDGAELSYFSMVMDSLAKLLTSTVAMVIYALLLIFVLAYVYYMLVWVPHAAKSGAQSGRPRSKKRSRRRKRL